MGIGDWGLGIWTQSPIPILPIPIFRANPQINFLYNFPAKKMAADNKYRKPGKKSK